MTYTLTAQGRTQTCSKNKAAKRFNNGFFMRERFTMAKSKTTIDDYKDRMTSPIGAVRIDPKTRQPINQDENKGKEEK